MSMARLIKKIALGSGNTHNAAMFRSYTSTSDTLKSSSKRERLSTWIFGSGQHRATPTGGVITKTEEFTVRSAPMDDVELRERNPAQDKSVHVGVKAVQAQDSGASEERGKVGLGKGRSGRHLEGDEETLIEPQPACVVQRRSEESSATQSMASDKR